MRRFIFLTSASLAAMALAPALLVLFALLAVAGVANAVTQPAINLFVAEQFPADRQGLGFGIKQSGIPAAIFLSGLALPLLALPIGWRATLALCALLPLAVAIALPRGGAEHVSRRTPSRRPSRALLLTAMGAARRQWPSRRCSRRASYGWPAGRARVRRRVNQLRPWGVSRMTYWIFHKLWV